MITIGVFMAGLLVFGSPALAFWVAIYYLTSD